MTYYVTKKGVVIPLMFPEGKKQPALIRICDNNEVLTAVLDYYIYGASFEWQNKKGKPEECKVVKIKRTHQDILSTISNPPSRKTLIHYLGILNDKNFVLSAKYHRELVINFEGIQTAINAIGAAGGYTKNVVSSSTTLQHSDDETMNVVMRELERLQHYNIELEENVVALSKKVVDLSVNVVMLSKKVEAATTLQHRFAALEEQVQDHFFGPTTSITTVLPSITSKDMAFALANRQPSPLVSLSSLIHQMSLTADAFSDEDEEADKPMPLVEMLFSGNEMDRWMAQTALDKASYSSALLAHRETQTARTITAPLVALPTGVSRIGEEISPNETTYQQQQASLSTSYPQSPDLGGDARPFPLPLSGVGGILPSAAETALHGKSSPLPPQTPLSPAKPSVVSNRGQETAFSQPSLLTVPPPAQQASTTKQDETPDPIATKQTGNGKDAEQKKEKPKGPPSMPADDAPWDAETFIQTLEAHKGRRYPNAAKKKADRVRDVEMEAAKTLLVDAVDLWEGRTTAECRDVLLKIVIRRETKDNNWWFDRQGHMKPHQLLADDRIHTIYDELVRMRQIKPKGEQTSFPLASPPAKPDVAETEAMRTRRRLKEMRAYAAQPVKQGE